MWCYTISAKPVLSGDEPAPSPPTNCSGSNRGLFLGLLIFVALVVAIVMYFVLISKNTNLSLLVLHTAESCLCLLTIVAMVITAVLLRPLRFSGVRKVGVSLNTSLLWVGLVGVLGYLGLNACAAGLVLHQLQGKLLMVSCAAGLAQVLVQTIFLSCCLRRYTDQPRLSAATPGREFITFLLVGSAALLALSVFELPRHQQAGLALGLYGLPAWYTLTNITLPLTLLYRFQAIICFAAIWRKMYKQRRTEFEMQSCV